MGDLEREGERAEWMEDGGGDDREGLKKSDEA